MKVVSQVHFDLAQIGFDAVRKLREAAISNDLPSNRATVLAAEQAWQSWASEQWVRAYGREPSVRTPRAGAA